MPTEKQMQFNANNFHKEEALTCVALSIQQPWAWLIANGHKNVENRNWSTTFRGEFYIHAGQKINYLGYNYAEHLIKSHALEIELPSISMLQIGGIVGTSTLIRCVIDHPGLWFRGPYGFVLQKSKPIPFLKMPGKLKFFNINLPIT